METAAQRFGDAQMQLVRVSTPLLIGTALEIYSGLASSRPSDKTHV